MQEINKQILKQQQEITQLEQDRDRYKNAVFDLLFEKQKVRSDEHPAVS